MERFFFEYPQPVPGEGRFIHTYRCDGSPIPSFSGEPEKVKLSGDIDTFTTVSYTHLDVYKRQLIWCARFVERW